MRSWVVAPGTYAALSALPLTGFAHGGYDAGHEALGGFIGGLVRGLIGTAFAPYPACVVPAPFVVEHYAPPPVISER